MNSPYQSWNAVYKTSAILGGILFFLQGVVFAYSHGTTPQNRELPVFGIEQALAIFIVAILGCLCFGIALLGFRIHMEKTGKLGKVMLKITQASIIGLVAAGFLQNIFVDPKTEWDSPIAIAGWLLQLLSWGVFGIGMVSLGIIFYRVIPSRKLGMLTLLTGVLAVFTIQAEMMIYQVSTGTVLWDMIHAGLFLPFCISWIFLAFSLDGSDRNSHALTS